MKTFRIGCGLLLFVGASWAQQYVISTVAGGAPPPTPVLGTTASIGLPRNLAVDAADNIYFTASRCVFKLDANGVMTRVAGNGRQSIFGDAGPATNAQLNDPHGVAVDGQGNLFIADGFHIWKVSPAGIMAPVAG